MSKSSKKAAKKALKKVVGVCLRCGDPLRRKDAKCRNCGRVSPLFAGKSASSVLVKSASGRVVPIWKARGRQRCAFGHKAPIGAQFCPDCGSPVGGDSASYLDWVAKGAPGAGTVLERQLVGEYDPARRAFLEQQAYAEAARRGELVPFIAKAAGFSTVEEAWRAETDPDRQQMYWQAMHPWLGGGSA